MSAMLKAGLPMSSKTHVAGALLVACYAVLAFLSRQESGIGLEAFLFCLSLAFAFYGFYAWRYKNHISVPAVLAWAVVFRIIGIFGEPLLEDDFYRYLWDGYRTAEYGDPYGSAPEDHFSDASVPSDLQEILGRINYPESPTVYGPVLQYLFGICHWRAPGELWPLKLILVAADLLLIGMLAAFTDRHKFMLYAWNPLVIKEVAFTAHPDVLIPMFLIAAWLCCRSGRYSASAILAALAIGIKMPMLAFTPFLFRYMPLRALLLFAATLMAMYLPLIPEGKNDLPALLNFASNWQFNSALFQLLATVTADTLARVLMAIGLMLYLFRLWIVQNRLEHRFFSTAELFFAGVLLFAPVINPWYWLWLLPFSVVSRHVWPWWASFALIFSYITGLNLEDYHLQAYQQPIWALSLEYAIVIGALIFDYRNRLTLVLRRVRELAVNGHERISH